MKLLMSCRLVRGPFVGAILLDLAVAAGVGAAARVRPARSLPPLPLASGQTTFYGPYISRAPCIKNG